MRKTQIVGTMLSLQVLFAGLMLSARPVNATSITYVYETGDVGEIEPCG